MGLQKNVASQKWRVFAFNRTNNVPLTGDALNITAKIGKDWAAAAATNDVNPTETEDGYYLFDLTQAETNADVMTLFPESSTSNIQVVGSPATIFTVPANFADMGIETDGHVHGDVKEWLGTAAATPTTAGVPEVDITFLGGVAQSLADLKDFADAGYDPATNKVQGVVLVDTTTTNTDMVGTDSAALASVCTESRLAELDGANLPTDVDAILLDTGTTIPGLLPSLITGTADSGSTTTMVDAVLTEADTDYWKDCWIRFTSGTINGQTRLITGFTPASDTVTFSPATTQAVGTNTYEILPASKVQGATLVDTLTTYTGNTVQSGDAFARLGAPAGASVSADIADVPTVSEFNARTLVSSSYSTHGAGDVWAIDATTQQTQGTFGQAIGDPEADASTIWGLANTNLDAAMSSRSSHSAADVWTSVTRALTAATNITSDASAINVTSGVVDTVTTVTTTTTNTDMRGTDSAALASVATEARLAELDGANLPTDIDAILLDTGTTIPGLLPSALTKGTADSGSTTTMVDAVRSEADTDYWKNSWIRFTSGTITGQTRLITGFTPGTDTITFAPATTQAVATNTYEIIPAGAVDVRLWAGVAPNALVSGAVDADVSAVQTGAITAAAIAADAIGASELATDAVNEIRDAVWANSTRTVSAATNITSDASAINVTSGVVDTVTTATTATSVTNRVTANTDQINGNANAAARLAITAANMLPGTVDNTSFTPTTTIFEADDITEATADHFNGRIVIWTSGALLQQATDITDYELVGGRGKLTVTALTEAPANNDTFIIV